MKLIIVYLLSIGAVVDREQCPEQPYAKKEVILLGGIMKHYIDRLEKALLSIDRIDSKAIVDKLRENFQPLEIAEKVIVPALERIGTGWEEGRIALSQVYMSGKISEELVDSLLPQGCPGRKNSPRLAIAVLDDYHMLGKRIVYSILRADGFDILDYGTMASDNLVNRAQQDQIEILLISTLMLPSALNVKDVTRSIKNSDSNIKVVVGGAPFRFDEDLWQEVGADAMGHNASEAVEIITQVLDGVK